MVKESEKSTMLSTLPTEVFELIDDKLSKLKYDDVMMELKETKPVLTPLDFDELQMSHVSNSDVSVQVRDNYLVKSIEYESEAECPEMVGLIDVLLIKAIDENVMTIVHEVGLDAVAIMDGIIRDAYAQNGLEYKNEGWRDAVKTLMSL